MSALRFKTCLFLENVREKMAHDNTGPHSPTIEEEEGDYSERFIPEKILTVTHHKVCIKKEIYVPFLLNLETRLDVILVPWTKYYVTRRRVLHTNAAKRSPHLQGRTIISP